MNRQSLFAFLVSGIAGALVWALSPSLTGRAEPWDAAPLFYPGALVVAGLGVGALTLESLWAHYLGSVAGQLGYALLFLSIGPLLLIGVVFVAGYSIAFVGAVALAAYLRNKLRTPHGAPPRQ